jgi:hypothetical protein
MPDCADLSLTSMSAPCFVRQARVKAAKGAPKGFSLEAGLTH